MDEKVKFFRSCVRFRDFRSVDMIKSSGPYVQYLY